MYSKQFYGEMCVYGLCFLLSAKERKQVGQKPHEELLPSLFSYLPMLIVTFCFMNMLVYFTKGLCSCSFSLRCFLHLPPILFNALGPANSNTGFPVG